MRGNFGFVELEEGWQILEMAFTKASKILEGYIDVRFTPEEYMNYYECVYRMCTQRPFQYAGVLCNRYKSKLEESIRSIVFPFLKDKNGHTLLRDLLKMWSNYKIMVHRLVSPILSDALKSVATDLQNQGEDIDIDLLRSIMSFIGEAEVAVPGFRNLFEVAIVYLSSGYNSQELYDFSPQSVMVHILMIWHA
ncbi:hypothetical protein C4D60_Mb05t18680 [Musa balbisiana]|uniref:Cullin N-terminal domain-containing protein n=1 Tax=Musa balbisiana TaxID=52838 RepID=A0A4S8JX48_MUSBA|nr:hypothetical protein C4D60_Mb05t18680 [Musa balbisiana]